MDLRHLLARNTAPEQQVDGTSIGQAARTPQMGVVTRTVVRSPVVRLIVPARIRHNDHNDIVFVHETHIEVKEFMPEGHFQKVAIKADFDAAIRSARAVGLPAKPMVQLEPTGIDAIIKPETGLLEDADTWSDPVEMDIGHHAGPAVPPQLLVLTLSNDVHDTLLFLGAVPGPADEIRFACSAKELPRIENTFHQQLGKHLAVDPRSRALAVAADVNCFSVFALKSMDEIRREIHASDAAAFSPIKEELHESVHGVIQKMEFLSPPPQDETGVILLLVVSWDERTVLMHFEWDSSTSLRTFRQMGSGYPVSAQEQSPLLLIPFTISTGFMLVCEEVNAVYPSILAGYTRPNIYPLHPLAPADGPEEPGSSGRFPLWTAWARPMRREDWRSRNEALYFCREDGFVRLLEFKEEVLQSHGYVKVGRLHASIDSAFAIVDNGLGGYKGDAGWGSYDVLVAAGDMGDGGLYLFGARKNAELRQSIASWTPLFDVALRSSTLSGPRAAPASVGRHDRIFACMGRGERQGAIGEIRYGIEAPSSFRVDIGLGVTGLWILPDRSDSGVWVLVAYPDHSDLFPIPDEQRPPPFGLDYESTTLAAGTNRDGLVVQVTQHSIRATTLRDGQSLVHRLPATQIDLASFEGRSSALLLAIRNPVGQVFLCFGQFGFDAEKLQLRGADGIDHLAPPSISSELSCMSLQLVGTQMMAFIGTRDQKLLVYRASHRHGLSLVCEYTFDHDFAICDSVALCFHPSPSEPGAVHVLCGLRDGSLHILELQSDLRAGAYTVEHRHSMIFGDTSVAVVTDAAAPTAVGFRRRRAFVSCGDLFGILELQGHRSEPGGPLVRKIFLTDEREPGFRQSSISTVAQLDPWNADGDRTPLSRLLFCTEGTQLHCAVPSYDQEQGAVMRRMPIGGTPSRIIYSHSLQMLVIAMTSNQTRKDGSGNGASRSRLLFPMIRFEDLDPMAWSAPPKPSAYLPSATSFVIGRSGERIVGMMEWLPSFAGTRYSFLLITTLLPSQNSGTGVGRIYRYRVGKDDDGAMSMDLKETIQRDEPVYSIASYGERSLVFGSGANLTLQTLTMDKKWSTPITAALRSPARMITTRESLVYVTTSAHSLSIYRVCEGELTLHFSDVIARNGLCHLALHESPLTIVSGNDNIVAGLWQPRNSQGVHSLRIGFEVTLSTSITRLWSSHASYGAPPSHRPAFLGTSLDGSLHHFTVLDEHAWRLLRFLQNLAERSPLVSPLRNPALRRKHIEPRPKNTHVDGDVLLRLLDRPSSSADTLLESMLQEFMDADDDAEFPTVAKRQRRVMELVNAVPLHASGPDLVAAIALFLNALLQPVI